MYYHVNSDSELLGDLYRSPPANESSILSSLALSSDMQLVPRISDVKLSLSYEGPETYLGLNASYK